MLEFTDAELDSYLDESLESSRAADLENELRQYPNLLERLSKINARRNAGVHTVGEIWRRNQVSVPAPEKMQAYLDGELSQDESDYIDFRIKELKCVFTLAIYHDLLAQQNDPGQHSRDRREKIFDRGSKLMKRNQQ